VRAFLKILLAAVLSVLLGAQARATVITHYWAMRTAHGEFGLIGYRESSGAVDTEIHYGAGYDAHVRIRLPIQLVALIIVVAGSVPPLFVAYFYARHRRRHRNAV
jgi:hypothetical protein